MTCQYDNLYNSLSYNLPEDDLTSDEKQDLVQLTTDLDQEKKEIIYILMLHDYTRYNPNTKVIFPYKSKQSGEKLEIKVDSMPIRLKRVIYKFLQVSNDKQDETPESSPDVTPLNF